MTIEERAKRAHEALDKCLTGLVTYEMAHAAIDDLAKAQGVDAEKVREALALWPRLQKAVGAADVMASIHGVHCAPEDVGLLDKLKALLESALRGKE